LISSKYTIKELADIYGTSRMSINRAKKRLIKPGFKKV
jgi:DNA-binding GntR family transcriptional regulator